MEETPITERSCELTHHIDIAQPLDIVQALYNCDKEIFSGYKQWPGLASHEDAISEVITQATRVLADRDGNTKIILSGCGTSGRLAFLAAQSYNTILQKRYGISKKIEYLLAGGDSGLFRSQELSEDDPQAGVNDLERAAPIGQYVGTHLYIGITCGLSAPYVAGQLHHAQQYPDRFYPVLMGFNPPELARDTKIEKWDMTFRQVVEEMQRTGHGTILTPIYGPEPITGSSRMKGGTTTKILLDIILSCAIRQACETTDSINVRDIIETYRVLQDSVYSQTSRIAAAVDQAGNLYQTGGHIYYVSDDPVGVLGLIDASECPPTYGADIEDVRGFIENGYGALSNNDGDCSNIMEISCSYFDSDIVPKLREWDSVFILQSTNQLLNEKLARSKANVMVIHVDPSGKQADAQVVKKSTIPVTILTEIPDTQIANLIGQSMTDFLLQPYREIVTKWLCNCITTGAHILKGKVFYNDMIDVQVRNDKLYRRAISIVAKFAEKSQKDSEHCLLRAIYETDTLDAHAHASPISKHIAEAASKQQVVPVAILLAKKGCTVREARAMITQTPTLRRLLETCFI